MIRPLIALIVIMFAAAPGATTSMGLLTQHVGQAPQRPILFNTTVNDPGVVTTKYYSFSAYQPLVPPVKPDVVWVARDTVFNNTGPRPYTVTVNIPNIEYSLGLLNVTVREYGGAQYDRPLYVFANGVPIFWGSTQEIYNSSAVSDITLYENMLKGSVTFQVVLVNYYAASVGITGVYQVNVSLSLYPGAAPAGLPTTFIPLWVNGFGYSSVTLNPFTQSYYENVTLPEGTYRLAAVVYTEGGGNDEFWYANEPATRSVLLYYNGLLADVVNPYETLYTGGLDLFYWKPMPSINTLSFHNPYIAELTPLLATGLNAVIGVSVTNLAEAYELTGSPFFSWTLSGALALWVNASNPLVSGRLTTMKSVYIDSSPIFNPSLSGEVYQEAGHYLLDYAATLVFEHGQENTQVIQKGTFNAYQTLSTLLESATLNEQFSENAMDTGIYNATLDFEGSYPVNLVFSAFETPITNPSVIPYKLVYAQNGSLSLGFQTRYVSVYDGQNYTQSVDEDVLAVGGFSAVIEVINQYGGAVLLSLGSNYAQTAKTLTATWSVNGQQNTESFRAVAVSPNVTDSSGYYAYLSISYT
ncbi:MAG: peptide-N4-asparagine amidase [Thermoprotei archaeon]